MSLVRIAARMALRQTLLGKTKVGDNVRDSEIGLIETGQDGVVTTESAKPFISIYSETSSARANIDLRAMVLNGLTDIVMDIGYTARHVEIDPETEESFVLDGVPASDDAFEFFLDMVVRQICDAISNPRDPWADLFRSLLIGVTSLDRSVATSGARGVRVALHQLRMRATLLADPVSGVPLKPETPMARFFAMAETLDPVSRVKAAEMLAQIETSATALEIAMRRYGMTRDEADALLLTAPAGVIDDTPMTDIATDRTEIVF